MSTDVTAELEAIDPPDEPRVIVDTPTAADLRYQRLAVGGGLTTLVLLVLIGLFLLLRSLPALRTAGPGFLTTFEWNPDVVTAPRFGIAAVMFGTVVIAFIALAIALPVAVLAAVFITDYAPRRVRAVLVTLVDLLAAVPSLIFGLWGLFFLTPRIVGLSRWLDTHLDFVPFLNTDRPQYAASAFIAGVVVALMVTPIITAVVREVFSQAPPGEKEAALALGGSRWGMIRTVVLPFGRGGIVGGAMLGLGRALGETIAVAIIISPVFDITPRILETGGNSVASLIALRFGESQEIGLSALMAAGLVLFLLTLVVNTLASVVVSRSRSGSGVEL